MSTHPKLWLVNATQDISALPIVCEHAKEAEQMIHVLYRPRDREAVVRMVPPGEKAPHLVELAEGAPIPSGIETEAEVFFLPCSERIDWSELRQRPSLAWSHCLQPLFADPLRVHSRFYLTGPPGWWGWRAGGELARRILREPSAWNGDAVGLIETLQHWPDPPRWQSMPIHTAGIENYAASSSSALTMSSTVLAVISFYRCEEWLHASLTSMAQQTRPPEAIVVVDDCSPALPLDLVKPFSNVTLLSTTRGVGPEKILNNIIKATDYDAYMVQDADDWSTHDRLELSLRGAERTGAEMVGCHELRVDISKKMPTLCIYPPDVNRAASLDVGHYLLHGTALISRELAMRVGGFDERLKLGADTEFVNRAAHAGRIVNLAGIFGFRRVRPASLTTHNQTGYRSSARQIEIHFIALRGRRNLELARAGRPANFFVEQKEPVGFIHHHGPSLRLSSRGLSV